MLRTLHGYLMRDLLRVMLLTLVALTLLLTVLAIIQPLRNVGLAGMQVLQVFVFTMPAVLSFTLPVATLFSATLVYGRFAQDNELLACRASGVSSLALLRPALVLGCVVTLISLTLSNVVAPSLSTMAGMVQSNFRGILYHRLKTEGYIEVGKGDRRYVIHADDVDAENNTLYGVVLAYVHKVRPPKNPQEKIRPSGAWMVTASAAYLQFLHDANGDAQVAIQPVDPSITQSGPKVAPSFAPDARTLQVLWPLGNPMEQKASWYNWTDLLAALREPSRHGPINREIDRIRQMACGDMLARDIIDAISAGKSYRQFALGDETYEVEAPAAHQDTDGCAVLQSATPGGPRGRRVSLVVRRAERVSEIITADTGKVVVTWNPVTRVPLVTLKLAGDVLVDFIGAAGRRENRATTWVRGEIPVPTSIRQRANDITLADMFHDPHGISRNKKVLQSITGLTKATIPRFQVALMAELHARVAYGVSCFLMVAMGAALGMLLRGGQFISAFATSALPGSAVIALVFMGKEMARNANINTTLGLATIWAGIVGLMAADVVLYLYLSRK